ncbi:MAG: MerR family transcriptional regulator, partial [Zhaonellaceae bacterium]
MIKDKNLPLYTIGVVSGIVGVHQETLRIWERNGLIT